MLLLKASIPEYLRSSPYLQSLLSNGPFPEEGLEIPDRSAKQDLTVNSKADLIELLSTLRFWLVPEVAELSPDLLRFAFFSESKTDFIEVTTDFRNDIPLVDELWQIVNSNDDKRLETAAGFGRVSVLKSLHMKGFEFTFRTTNIILAAARGGHFECAKYIVNCCSKKHKQIYIQFACKEAAQQGHSSCVKQMLKEWTPFSGITMIGAALGNHLDILTYASGVGHNEADVVEAMAVCAQKGYLECLKHLHSLNYELNEPRLVNYATAEGQLDCLKFMVEHNYAAEEDLCNVAVEKGRLETLKYVHELGMPWDEYTCSISAEGGHLECLQYMREHGCPWWDGPAEEDLPVNDHTKESAIQIKVASDEEQDDALIAASACQAPTIDCLLYVQEQGAALSPACATSASRSGSLATLQFLHARGFTWEESDSKAAVESQSLECVRFLNEIGTPWHERALSYATQHKNLPILQYALEHGAVWHADSSLEFTLDKMKFVHENGCPWHVNTCLTAAKLGDLECLQYAHEHGAPWTSEVCRQATTIECYEYAVAHGCPGAELNKKMLAISKKRKL